MDEIGIKKVGKLHWTLSTILMFHLQWYKDECDSILRCSTFAASIFTREIRVWRYLLLLLRLMYIVCEARLVVPPEVWAHPILFVDGRWFEEITTRFAATHVLRLFSMSPFNHYRNGCKQRPIFVLSLHDWFPKLQHRVTDQFSLIIFIYFLLDDIMFDMITHDVPPTLFGTIIVDDCTFNLWLLRDVVVLSAVCGGGSCPEIPPMICLNLSFLPELHKRSETQEFLRGFVLPMIPHIYSLKIPRDVYKIHSRIHLRRRLFPFKHNTMVQ